VTTHESSAIRSDLNVPFSYAVHFTVGVFNLDNPLLEQVVRQTHGHSSEKVLVVVEEAIADARPTITREIESYFRERLPELIVPCAPIVIRGGESAKNETAPVEQVIELIHRFKLSRHSYVIGVGGGALLDVVGFAAAIAHRGVRHIRIPTTTLSQADAGVGVKNGINAFGKKNFIGAFAPPFAVINDGEFLELLPGPRRSAGYVEAVKVALIRDAEFFYDIERSADDLNAFHLVAMRRLVRRCAELHVRHITQGGDPFEFGSARPLDFGHWAAHKLEQLSDFRIGHAEAVAIGIAVDVIYSRDAGYLEGSAADRILALLSKLRFRLFAEELEQTEENGRPAILSGLDDFREHLGGELTITLLRDIGQSVEVHEMNRASVLRAVEELRDRDRGREKR
jgi:3-dehydroquinate synthase